MLEPYGYGRSGDSRFGKGDWRADAHSTALGEPGCVAQAAWAWTPPARPISQDGVPAPPPPTTYPFAMWELVGLADGLFLMLDPRKGPALRRIADEIYKHYSLTVPSTH
jgi:hypothetical protein